MDDVPPKGLGAAVVVDPPPNENVELAALLFPCAFAVCVIPPKTGALIAVAVCDEFELSPNENAFDVFDIPPPNTDDAVVVVADCVAGWAPPKGLALGATVFPGALNPNDVAAGFVAAGAAVPLPPKENIDGTLLVAGADVVTGAAVDPLPPPKLNVVCGLGMDEAAGTRAGVGSLEGVLPNAKVEFRFVEGFAGAVNAD